MFLLRLVWLCGAGGDRRAQAGGGTALMWCWQSSKAGADGIWEFPFLALLLRPGLRGEGVWAHSSQPKERFPTPNRAESQGPVLEQLLSAAVGAAPAQSPDRGTAAPGTRGWFLRTRWAASPAPAHQCSLSASPCAHSPCPPGVTSLPHSPRAPLLLSQHRSSSCCSSLPRERHQIPNFKEKRKEE